VQPDRKNSSLEYVLQYHRETKHGFDGFANGPGYLDWATQPDPFRRYADASLIALERCEPTNEPLFDDVFNVEHLTPPAPVCLRTISRLFYDSLAISAWKSTGGARWALRVNASSGNLHPTEGYLICGPVPGLCDKPMVAHYAPREHALEVLGEFDHGLWGSLRDGFPAHTFFLGLSSIHWREAWKYGRRAYRYCMHDAGHAMCAISVAAGGLGWRTHLLDDLGSDDLGCLMGTDRAHDAEKEEPDLLLACIASGGVAAQTGLPEMACHAFASLPWQGRPNNLSPSHVDWGMEAIAKVVRKPANSGRYAGSPALRVPCSLARRGISLRAMIRQRRSAVAMDGHTSMLRSTFYLMLCRTLTVPEKIPFSTLPWKPHLHLALFVHRVENLAPGLYLLVRDVSQTRVLKKTLRREFEWARPPACPEELPLYRLAEGDARDMAKQIACQQDIASDGCFSLAMIAEFKAPLEKHGAWFYPRLYWEAGLIGQLLYLEAEAAGLRSTGIGCFFDDPVHKLLGLENEEFQDLYHFTVGGPVEDTRLTTLPAYPGI
jgi:SagB-type dehydrogenase family enzyme